MERDLILDFIPLFSGKIKFNEEDLREMTKEVLKGRACHYFVDEKDVEKKGNFYSLLGIGYNSTWTDN